MTRIVAWALAGLAVAALGGPARAETEPPKPAEIVVNASGGTQEAGARKAFYEEFERRTGIKVVATSPPNFAKLVAMEKAGAIEWTITELDIEEAIRAEKMGLLAPIDDKIVDRSSFPGEARTRKYIFSRAVYSTVMGYRTDAWPAGKGPRNWKDFWDVAKFPGPRSMQNRPVDNLEFALLADGVAPDKLYPIDVDRAFRKLDAIKKHVAVWWKTGAQSAQLLIDKEVVLGTAWNGRYFAAIAKGAPIHVEWNQGSLKESAFVIPKGAPNAYWGQRLFAVMTEAKRQAIYADYATYPGLNLESVRYTNPKIAPNLPTHPNNLSRQFWQNAQWWADHGAAMEERWAKWVIAK
ncbi:MAG: ABC transporter substrate-binding protein [Rhodospirillaceae bacterium]|nr:ABC transporter substrate-binding protein [Rhodospirillaceae bacterium]